MVRLLQPGLLVASLAPLLLLCLVAAQDIIASSAAPVLDPRSDTFAASLPQSLLHTHGLRTLPASCCSLQIAASLAITGFHGTLNLALQHRQRLSSSDSTTCGSHAQSLLIIQHLPRGIFADPYELETWAKEHEARSQAANVRFHGQVDVESISSQALPQAVSIMLPIGSFNCQTQCADPSAAVCGNHTLSLPLHARYAEAAAATHESRLWGSHFVQLQLPDTIAVCCTTAAETSKHAGTRLEHALVGVGGTLQWTIPVGAQDHAAVVAVLTLAITLVGGAAVVWQLLASPLPGL